MRIVGAIFSIAVLAGYAHAEDDAAIEDVISSQLSAFNARDVDSAWQYASPMIQRLFGNPRNFGAMVENGYPMVWTNEVTQFLELTPLQGRQLQRVLIRDAGGVPHVLEYLMVETPDGWRIDGVSILPAPEVGA